MDRDKTIKAGNAVSKALSENKFELFNRPMNPVNPIKTYRIENRITKEVITIPARSAQDAAESVGWFIGNCYIRILGE